jgi:hypothetical protein
MMLNGNPEKKLLNSQMLQTLSDNIKNVFPTFVASVVADKHGFLLHSESKKKLDHNLLALTAICKDRKIIDLSNYHKLIKPLSKEINLLVLLSKSRENYKKYGKFESIIQKNNPL